MPKVKFTKVEGETIKKVIDIVKAEALAEAKAETVTTQCLRCGGKTHEPNEYCDAMQ